MPYVIHLSPDLEQNLNLLARELAENPNLQSNAELLLRVIEGLLEELPERTVLKPLNLMNAAPWSVKLAKLSISAMQKGFMSVSPRIVRGLSAEQLRALAPFIAEISGQN